MEFTYDAYKNLLSTAKAAGYDFCGYKNYHNKPLAIILRHDIDFYLDYALDFAEIEADMGAKATYFVEVTSEFYNVMARTDKAKLRRISALGHNVGLHFDRTQYGEDFSCFSPGYDKVVAHETEVLQQALGKKVELFSYHQPLKEEIEANYQLNGLTNAYDKEYFENFKYFSDSLMNWREPPLESIAQKTHPRIQLLTHPFWYSNENSGIKQMLLRFINSGSAARYVKTRDMCFYLDDYVKEDEVE